MKKVVGLTLALSAMIAAPVFAETVPSSQHITVDGAAVEAQGYNIDGNNYFKLRDIAALLAGKEASFNVDYDENKKSIEITRDADYTRLGTDLVKSDDNDEIDSRPSFQKVYINNELVYYDSYFINGNNYFKIRDLGKTIGFYVDFDEENNTIIIKSKKVPPKDLIEKEHVSFISFASDGMDNVSSFRFDEKKELAADDFIKEMGNVVLLSRDGRHYPATIEYNEDSNTFVMEPKLYKIKGQLYFEPYIKVQQNDRTEFFRYSKNLNLEDLFKDFSEDEDLTLTLGYYLGDDNKPQDFKGACKISFTEQ